jgi:hypothetical protein
MDKIRKDLSKLLNDTYKSNNRYLTNKTCRKIKKMVNKELCLLDHLFQGLHADSTLISSHKNEEKEIDVICENFNSASYMVVKRAEKTINKWEDEKTNTDKNLLESYKRLIILGYEKYKKIKPKKNVNEIILAYEFYKYYENIPSMINESELLLLENYFNNMFKNYNPEILNNYFTLVIDITTDMKYGTLERALFNCIFMVKFFKLRKIYRLTNGTFFPLDFNEEDFKKSYLELIPKIYTKYFGNNTSVEKLDLITKSNFIKKNILFLTCEKGLIKIESNLINQPLNFKSQLENYEFINNKNNNIIILNLKKNKFGIPYYDSKKNITLIDGNKINLFFCIIKQIYESYTLNFNINNLITGFNDFIEVNNLEPLPIYKKILPEDKILVMYNAYKNNLAPLHKT